MTAVRAAASAAAGALARSTVAARRAIAAHVYVSEGRDAALLADLAAAGAATGARLANEFADVAYHRAGITLTSVEDGVLEAGVVAVCHEALRRLDLRSHIASHPRLGTVDHVALNPLGEASCEEAGELAARLGRRLGGSRPGPAVPVYLYGAARADGRPLDELRRHLGYFGGARGGEWAGLSEEMAAAIRALAPDFGPREPDPRHGAVVIGAVPWVHNYNILVTGTELSQDDLMARCRRVARAVSSRGGGPPAVQTMALLHERGVEVACNLLDVSRTPPAEVLARVEALCAEEFLTVDSHYFTNKRPDEVLVLAPPP